MLLIVGILAGAATLSITSRPLQAHQHTEAQRLQQLISLAADQAQLQGRQVGLRVTRDGYTFVTLDDAHRWVPFTEGTLRARKLPPPFTLRLSVDNAPENATAASVTADRLAAPDPSRTDGETSDRRQVPQILFLSSGESTPFQLDVRAPGLPQDWQLSGDALGNVTLAQVAAQ